LSDAPVRSHVGVRIRASSHPYWLGFPAFDGALRWGNSNQSTEVGIYKKGREEMQSVKELVAQANSRVKTVTVQEAALLLSDSNAVFVDLRDSSELLRDGKIPGSVHVNRGMLEFAVDPTLPYHNPVFSSGKKFLFYCASGGRSALAADTAQSMGLAHVSHLGGGFRIWKEANQPVENRCGRSKSVEDRVPWTQGVAARSL
jgi:rhodanese-related sulfurtransferase